MHHYSCSFDSQDGKLTEWNLAHLLVRAVRSSSLAAGTGLAAREVHLNERILYDGDTKKGIRSKWGKRADDGQGWFQVQSNAKQVSSAMRPASDERIHAAQQPLLQPPVILAWAMLWRSSHRLKSGFCSSALWRPPCVFSDAIAS